MPGCGLLIRFEPLGGCFDPKTHHTMGRNLRGYLRIIVMPLTMEVSQATRGTIIALHAEGYSVTDIDR